MRSLRIVSTLIGAGIVAASITVPAMPAVALGPVTYAIDCTIQSSVTESIPIYQGQDAVFTFSPVGCNRAYWSALNPALSDMNASSTPPFSSRSSITIAAADIICGNSFDIYDDGYDESYYLTFTGCGVAPAEAPAAAPLPDTGLDATAFGLAAAGLLAAGVATIVVVRRRNA
jgi:LPXTG-motif cell wall-anchored protein